MPINIGDVQARITADTVQFQRGMRNAQQQLGRFDREGANAARGVTRNFQRIETGARGVQARVSALSTAMRGLAAVAGVAIAGRFVTQAVAATDAIGKFADRVGIGVEALQEFRFAASQTGVEQRTFDLALQRFTRRVAEAAQGTGEAQATLQQLGIQLTDTSGRIRPTEVLLGEVADRLRELPTQSDRVRAAFKLFDSEGVALVNTLNLGSRGMQQLRDDARRLGLVLSESTVRQAEAANDELDRMQRILRAQLTRAALAVTPQIISLGESVGRMAEALTGGNEALGRLSDQEATVVQTLQAIAQGFDIASTAARRFLEGVNETIGAGKALRLIPGLFPTDVGETPEELAQHRRRILERAFPTLPVDIGAGFTPPTLPEQTATGQRLPLPTPTAAGGAGPARRTAADQLTRDLQALTPSSFTAAAEAIEQMVRRQTPLLEALGNEARETGADFGSLEDAFTSIEQQVRQLPDGFEEAQEAMRQMRQEAAQLTERFATPLQRFEQDTQRVQALLSEGLITPGTAERASREMTLAFNRTTAAGQTIIALTDSIGQAFQASFQGIIQGTQSVREAFANMAQSIGLSLLNSALQRGLQALQEGLLAGSSGGIAQALGLAAAQGAAGGAAGGIGSGGGSGLSNILLAQHGAVVTRPSLVLAGENPATTPEFILNRQQMQRMQGQGEVRITNIAVQSRAEAEQQAAAARSRGEVVNIIDEELALRGGSRIVRSMREALRERR